MPAATAGDYWRVQTLTELYATPVGHQEVGRFALNFADGFRYVAIKTGSGASCWTNETTGGGGSAAVSGTLFVDTGTSLSTADQTGAPGAPYKTITQALAQVPAATDTATASVMWMIQIAPGLYDEDLTYDVTARRVTLFAPFGFRLGDSAVTRRNITLTGSAASVGGQPSFFGATSVRSEYVGAFSAVYAPQKVWISGKVSFALTAGTVLTTQIDAYIEGSTGLATGVSIEQTTSTFSFLSLRGSLLTGQITDTLEKIILTEAVGVYFGGAVRTFQYYRIQGCFINSSWQTKFATSPAAALGMVNTRWNSGQTFTGPVNSLVMDDFTAYVTPTLAGGATVVNTSKITPATTVDLSGIAAATAALKATATSDAPVTVYAAHIASTDPAGYIKLDVGGAARYIPFYT